MGDDSLIAAALDAFPAEVVILDEEGDIVRANQRWRAFARQRDGTVPEDPTGVNYLDICDSLKWEATAEIKAGITAVLEGAQEQYTLTYPDDSRDAERWYLLHTHAFGYQDSEFVLVTHIDVTELGVDSLSPRERARRLEAAVSILAHDIQSPLATARGYADLLETEDEAYVNRIKNGIARIETIVDDARALTRSAIEGDTIVDLETTCRDIWAAIETDDATLVVEGTVQFYADSILLEHALENLFRNAVDHGPPDVTARVGPENTGFYVEDDGPGIPDDITDDLFEPGTTTREGYGLGLAIVDHAASAHGWRLDVEESETGGARFVFSDLETPE